MNTKEQELKNSIEDLREELIKFENELEELVELNIKVGDIVRIISDSPIRFSISSPFVVGAYCKVVNIDRCDRILIKLHESVYYGTNTCEKCQVELVWSS
jgi:hypothetical protein